MDLQALKELHAAVKAGTATQYSIFMEAHVKTEWQALEQEFRHEAWKAHNGDLNAARALHDALLPDMGWEILWVAKYPNLMNSNNGHQYRASVGWGRSWYGTNDDPARAWLIATLSALIAQEEQK